MSLRLYFLRHGETIYSQSGGYCGEIDPELTPEGDQMAQDFAEAYKNFPWQAVYVSPKKRTMATAKPLCEAIGVEMQIREGLREIAYGQWEGKSAEEVREQFPEDYVRWLTEPAWNPPTGGGETSVEIASRAMAVIAEIKQNHADGNVLIVSHKATIRIILCSLLGIDTGRYRDRIDCLAASISVVKLDVNGPLLQILGDRTHMSDELRDRPGT
jgi:broad specificity phosphatase PhoE